MCESAWPLSIPADSHWKTRKLERSHDAGANLARIRYLPASYALPILPIYALAKLPSTLQRTQ